MVHESRRAFMKIAASSTIAAASQTRATSSCAAPFTPDPRMKDLGFRAYNFNHGAYEHAVYVKGTGHVVIVMHELPGFDKSTVNFLDRLVEHGFCVHAPLLFGPMLSSDSVGNYIGLCISREFAYLKSNRSAPVCDWLRALARCLSEQNDNARIGVIGMCLTGAFVIPMVIEPGTHAGVISQPAIPISFRYVLSKATQGEGPWMQEMNISDEDIETAARRCARDGVPILVQRFTNDLISTHERVERIRKIFGSTATLYEYDDPGSDDFPHAVLTTEFDDACEYDVVDHERPNPTRIALQRVVAFLHENLDARSS
ncbi:MULTISPECIES: dienelactone hydrolase family protein [Caballeronia]|uniref:Dienelactone hydrolase family protein n=2 Tax=Caballeronia TaxID=1827195 RepID=A0ACB5QLT1_9BURK|nr:dienelactone hydrolase family protein [Caballeronia sp. GaOx3]GJH16145.1 dienelactone hydrolase family protein [Caballeronia novacaledonica]